MDEDTRKRLLAMMFGEAAPMIDINTCARVMYKPIKTSDNMAWMPIGWETHQPMIFVMARDKVSSLLNAKGEQEVDMVVRSYVCMDSLSPDLKDRIREHLGLKPVESKEAN